MNGPCAERLWRAAEAFSEAGRERDPDGPGPDLSREWDALSGAAVAYAECIGHPESKNGGSGNGRQFSDRWRTESEIHARARYSVVETLRSQGPLLLDELKNRSGLCEEAALRALAVLAGEGRVLLRGPSWCLRETMTLSDREELLVADLRAVGEFLIGHDDLEAAFERIEQQLRGKEGASFAKWPETLPHPTADEPDDGDLPLLHLRKDSMRCLEDGRAVCEYRDEARHTVVWATLQGQVVRVVEHDWPEFHFETGHCWGAVRSRVEWHEMVRRYLALSGSGSEQELLDLCRRAEPPRIRPDLTLAEERKLRKLAYGEVPSFGLKIEHRGETLREFLTREGPQVASPDEQEEMDGDILAEDGLTDG